MGINSEQIVFIRTKQNSPGVKINLSVRFILRRAYFSVFQSDDSLDHLSAEEKACLLFLEETIEALDTEEDSGMSNDEPDQLPNSANLGTKLADPSASMNKSKPNSGFFSGYRSF